MNDYLNLTTFIVIMIVLLIFRKYQKEIDIECDKSEITPSDYTIFVKDIPLKDNFNYKENLKKFFEKDIFKN